MRSTIPALCALLLPVSCRSLTRDQEATLTAAHGRLESVPTTVTRQQAQAVLGRPTSRRDRQTLVWETAADPVNFERLAAKFDGKGPAKSMLWLSSRGDNHGLYRHQKIEGFKSETGRPRFLWTRRIGLRLASPPSGDALLDDSDLWP